MHHAQAYQMLFLKFRWDLINHSSEIRGLHSIKCSRETLHNTLYSMYKKTLSLSDQGIHKGKCKVAIDVKE